MHIVITTLGIDLKTPAGRLVFGMMSQISEFERELIRERVKAGMTEARKRGVHTGRKHKLTPSQRAEAARMHHCDGKSLAQIGRSVRLWSVGGAPGRTGCCSRMLRMNSALILSYSPSVFRVLMPIRSRNAIARASPSGSGSSSFHARPRGVWWTIRGTLIVAAWAGLAGRLRGRDATARPV